MPIVSLALLGHVLPTHFDPQGEQVIHSQEMPERSPQVRRSVQSARSLSCAWPVFVVAFPRTLIVRLLELIVRR